MATKMVPLTVRVLFELDVKGNGNVQMSRLQQMCLNHLNNR